MARLILKSPYIKSTGGAAGYLRYIATRERVEILPDDRPPTRKQEQLIAKLVKDFPDTKTLYEYESFQTKPTKAAASAFLTLALESNWDALRQSEQYLKYIATRPRAERLGSHGLFGDSDGVSLEKAMAELEQYTGNVWTHIISLKREDAARLGFDNAAAWRNLIRAHRNEIAAAMKIPPADFRWYAAFHDEGEHPHIHMMAWSATPGQAYLSKEGIRQIKSRLTNDIFRDEMLHLYEQKSESRDELVRQARRAMLELVQSMRDGLCDHPEAEQLMQELAVQLGTVKGKKTYGYLPKRLKELVDEIVSGMEAILVLDKTPFYAEMGGQVADHGVITGDGMEFVVSDVQKNKGGKFMHYGKLLSGSVAVGDSVTASIDTDRRAAIRRAHSATHLLDAALVKVLGDHVHQAGSLVEPDRLRFDFTHFEGITPKQLDEVEDMVNDAILSGLLITTEELPIAEAKARGAVATFGEKYGQTVRVVTMGDFSMELCGGTHLDNTAKAGPFRIKSESSVASGVRRIEATTGKVTMEDMRRSRGLLNRASQFFKSAPETLMERLEQQASEMKALRQALEKFKSEASMGEAKQILASAKTVDGLHVITGTRQGLDANALRLMGDFLRDKDPHVVGVLASIVGEKVTFLAVCGKEAVARGVKAGNLVKTVSAVCGGKGGGKPDSAMGGGTDLLKVDDALAAVDDFVAEKLK